MTTETGTENFQVASGNFSTPSNEISNIEKEDFVPEVPKKPFSAYITVCILCLFVAFGGFIFGWDTGTISGFINQSDYKGRFADKVDKDGLPSFSNTRTGLIVSFFNIGCAVGGIILSKLGDVYGRKKGLTIVTLIYCIGIVVQITTTTKWYQYFIGRIIAGLGVGATAVLSPMLISETSPKHLRGALVSCYQLMITAGIFMGNCSNYGTKNSYSDAKQWRIPLGLGFAWAAFMILGMTMVPESPRYLIENGKLEEARRSLAKVNKVPMDDRTVNEEMDAIQAGVESEKLAGSASWGELFSTKTKVFQRVIMGILVQSLQQLTGINYFFYYGVSIFKSVGLDDSFQTAIILSCVNLVSTFFCIYIVGRFGRRTCLLWASFAMSFLMLAFATIGTVKLKSDDPAKNSKSAGNGMIVVTCLYIFCFATTWAPLAFVIVSETFPLRIKSKGMAVATAANWVWNFLIGFFTPFITSAIRFSYGYVFMGSLMFAFVYIFFSVPETKGLTLEEVEEMWQEGVLPWKSGSWVPASRRDATYDAAALTHDDKPWYKQMF